METRRYLDDAESISDIVNAAMETLSDRERDFAANASGSRLDWYALELLIEQLSRAHDEFGGMPSS
jgi:hypothetical protein